MELCAASVSRTARGLKNHNYRPFRPQPVVSFVNVHVCVCACNHGSPLTSPHMLCLNAIFYFINFKNNIKLYVFIWLHVVSCIPSIVVEWFKGARFALLKCLQEPTKKTWCALPKK